MNNKKDILINIEKEAYNGLTQQEIVKTIFDGSSEMQKSYLAFLKNHLEGFSSNYTGLETNIHEAFNEIVTNYSSKITPELLSALLKTELETNNFQGKDFWKVVIKKAQENGVEKTEIKEYLLKNKNLVGILTLDEPLTASEVEVFIEHEDYLMPEHILELFIRYDNVFQKEFFDRAMMENCLDSSFNLSNKVLFFFRGYISQPDCVIKHGHKIINTISQTKIANESYGYDEVSFKLANLFRYLDDVPFLEHALEAGDEKIDVEMIFENCSAKVKSHEQFPELLIKYNKNVLMNGAERSNVLTHLTFDLQCNTQVLKYLSFRKEMKDGLSEQEYLQKIEQDWTQFIAVPRELKESPVFVNKVEDILDKKGLGGNIGFWLMLPPELKIEKSRLKKYIVNEEKQVEPLLRASRTVLKMFDDVAIDNDEVFFEVLDALIPSTRKIICDVDYYLDCLRNKTFYKLFKKLFLSDIIDNVYSLEDVLKKVVVTYQEDKMKNDVLFSESLIEKKKIRKF